MKHSDLDTIAAIVSPLGVGGIGIVRICGEQALSIASRVFVASNHEVFSSHKMLHGWLLLPDTQQKIDEVMACYLQAPHSFTGEDAVEFYCHGGVVVLRQALEMVLRSGARLAERGEFTKRAFLNGKLDLTQAEAIMDLVTAPTEKSAGFAVQQLAGRLSKEVQAIRKELLELLAELEANLDFPDDVAEPSFETWGKRLERVQAEINRFLQAEETGKLFREGVAAAILGKPNVGKSSLLNRLLGEERAITSSLPGTTRDTIEEALSIGGMPVRVVDTAGIRHPKDEVEHFGVERAREEARAADFAVVVIDGSQPLDDLDEQVFHLTEKKTRIVAENKKDLCLAESLKSLNQRLGCPVVTISALTGEGIEELKREIYATITQGREAETNAVFINSRHRECLLRARQALLRAGSNAGQGGPLPIELCASDLKEAIVALGEISGEQVSEEVLEMIFSQFCVGK